MNGAWVSNRSVLIGVNFCKHSWFYKIINKIALHDFRHNRTKGNGPKVAVNIAYWFFFRNWYNICVFPRLWETSFAIRLIFNFCNGNGAKISAFSLTTQPEMASGPVDLLEFSVSKLLKIWISQTWKSCALRWSIICWLFGSKGVNSFIGAAYFLFVNGRCLPKRPMPSLLAFWMLHNAFPL
jgi:hypothetical protein